MASNKSFGPSRPSSLAQPVIMGMILFLLFSAMSSLPSMQNELIQRYMFGHSINRMSSALFFVGVAAVALAAWNVWNQRRQLPQIGLGQNSGEQVGSIHHDCCENERQAESALAAHLLQKLDRLATNLKCNGLAQRLTRVLGIIERDGADLAIYNRLEQLSDEEADLQSQRYAFPRMLVWATPLLGFLGTVLGISEAMGGLSAGADSDLQQMMGGLQSNLNVAFDTTAQALVLSIVLMFAVFTVERQETLLLLEISSRTESEICNWFALADELQPAPTVQFDEQVREQLQAQTRLLAQAAAAEVTDAWKSAAHRQAKLAEMAIGSMKQLNDGLRDLTKEKAEEVVEIWTRTTEKHFELLSSQPTASHRIESALIQMTTALGELQRQLNQSRPETARTSGSRDDLANSPVLPMVVFDRPPTQRKTA